MEFATVPNWRKQATDGMRRSIPITAYGPSSRHAHLGAIDQLLLTSFDDCVTNFEIIHHTNETVK
jgi:hypothetical protein